MECAAPCPVVAGGYFTWTVAAESFPLAKSWTRIVQAPGMSFFAGFTFTSRNPSTAA